MLDQSMTFNYDGAPLEVRRINQDNFSSIYFGETADEKVTLTISHTIPARGSAGESHLVRFDVEHYDATGVFVRQSSAWSVIKTFDGTQDTPSSKAAMEGLTAFLAVSGTLDKVLARES